MVGPTRPPRIPLPSGWPLRVRSAVIHVISLAHYSLTSTRSWAANNWNARINGILKSERVHDRAYQTRDEARLDVFYYIEGFYNRNRLHSSLGYLGPEAYELRYQNSMTDA